MRTLLALFMLTTSALAAGWTPFFNPRFGASVEIPGGFVNDVPPPENGDGLTFHDPARQAELLIWGENLVSWDFKQDAAERIAAEKKDGWAITFERGRGLDRPQAGAWHVYSGIKGGRIVYAKAVASCKGTQAVQFRLEYPMARKDEFNDIASHLAASLRAGPAEACGNR
jgi:hypothetical protein